MAHEPVELEIAGRIVSVRTDDPDKARRAAALVQAQLDELRASGASPSTDRLLMLAALNLAAEILTIEEHLDAEAARLRARMRELYSRMKGLADAPLR